LSPAECTRLEARAAVELMRTLPYEELSGLWHSLNRGLQDDEVVIDSYAARLIQAEQHAKAEELIRKALDRNWRPLLARRYGEVRGKDLVRQLKVAEHWAAEHPEDPNLMLTLAHLSLANQLWGKARAALEACIANGGSVEAYRELGHLLERLDDADSAMTAYRKGLDQAGGPRPDSGPDKPKVTPLRKAKAS